MAHVLLERVSQSLVSIQRSGNENDLSLVFICAISTRMSGIRKRSNVGEDPVRFKMAWESS